MIHNQYNNYILLNILKTSTKHIKIYNINTSYYTLKYII